MASHVLGLGVHRRQVEGEAVQAAALQGRFGSREVAVPRLVGSAGERDVEADLDDPVVGAENRAAHRDEPGVGGDVDEAADALGLDLDVPALGAARQGAARDCARLLEQRHDLIVHAVGPFGRECAGKGDDPVAVEAAHDRCGIVMLVGHAALPSPGWPNYHLPLAMRAPMGLGRQRMRFFSDNAAAAHPKVIEAIAASNRLDTAYDGDAWSRRLDAAFSQLFEREVRALWVTTGTAANCLALAALCPPYGAIICHKDAHIENDEAGAPGFFTGGAKLMLVDGPGAKVTPGAAEAAIGRVRKDVHQVQPKVLSITNATEYGLAYSASEVGALGELAGRHGLGFHMDGARFANAVVSSGETPADLTWRAGVDALSFGFVKNGGLNAEALVLFRTELADEIAVRRKRSGHLLSKGRMLAAQILALLEDELWLANARAANAAAQAIAKAAGGRLVHPVEANEIFVRATADEAAALRAQGFDFYDWGPGEIRLVTSWDQAGEPVDRLAAAIAAL